MNSFANLFTTGAVNEFRAATQRFLDFLSVEISEFLNRLNYNNTPLYNNNFIYIQRRGPEDEDLGYDADDLSARHSTDDQERREALENLKRTYGFDPDTPEEKKSVKNWKNC